MGFSLKPSDRKYKDIKEDFVNPIVESKNELQVSENEFNPWDYLRVVNVRGEPEFQATKEEKVILGHRANPILGNKHPMLVQTMKERDRVIEEHKKDFEADLAVQGSIWKALQEIARDIVENKQKIAISCHCSPTRCHCDSYVPVVVEMATELLNETQNIPSNKKPKL